MCGYYEFIIRIALVTIVDINNIYVAYFPLQSCVNGIHCY